MLSAVRVAVVVVTLVERVPATATFAPRVRDPLLRSRMVFAGTESNEFTTSASFTFRVPVPVIVSVSVAGMVTLLETVRTALFSSDSRVSSVRDNVLMVPFALALSVEFVPVMETELTVAPDPFSTRMLELLSKVMALELLKVPGPVKFREDA